MMAQRHVIRLLASAPIRMDRTYALADRATVAMEELALVRK